jgi:hypothetical protein
MRLLTIAIAAVFALPVTAATRYTVSVGAHKATVLADGARRRVDITHLSPPFEFDVLLSDDGGATFTALNTPLKTWFHTKATSIERRPHFFWHQLMTRISISDVRVTTTDELEHKSVIKTTFTVREPQATVKFASTIAIWTTDAVDAALAVHPIDLTTSYPEVDAQLLPALAKVRGFPIKTVLTATRQYFGGPPQTLTSTATVSGIETITAPKHAFERPADFVYQPPILGVPGR